MELVPCSLLPRNQRRRRENPKVPAALDWKTITLDDLCDALLIEILSRLPLKQLKRCLAVSRRWYALISNPLLIRLFGEKHKNFAFLLNSVESIVEDNTVGKLLVISKEPDDFKSQGFSLSFLPCYRPSLKDAATVQASCNDLLLCSDQWWEVYYVCNPFTLDWVQLPPNPHFKGGLGGIGFFCDYSYSNSGATSTACRYMVVGVIKLPHDGSSEFQINVQIYSSELGEWKENVVSCGRKPFVSPAHRQNAIYYNGLLFFSSHSHGLMGLDPYEGGQLRHLIPVPQKFALYSVRCFGVCRGSIRLFEIVEYPFSFVRIWDLEDYEKGEWVLEKQVCFRDMVSGSCGWVIDVADTPDFWPTVIACDPNDGDVVYFVAKRGHGHLFKVVSCNLHMGTLEEVCDIPRKICVIWEVVTYKPSWCPTPISPPYQRMP